MPEPKSTNSTDNILSKIYKPFLLSLLLGIVIFVGLSLYADVTQVTQALAAFQWAYLAPVLILVLGNYFVRFTKWDYYLRVIHARPATRDSLSIFFSGLGMAATPGKLGEILKAFLLKRINNTEISKTVSVVVAERITDALGLLALVIISLPAFPAVNRILVMIPAALLVVVVVLLLWRRLCYKVIEALNTIPFLRRYTGSIRRGYDTAYLLLKGKNLLIAFTISVFSWTFECAATYLILQALGGNSSFWFSTFIFASSTLIGAISMVPGGLFVAEGSLAGLLILSGSSRSFAATATLMIRFCTLWFAVILGLAVIALTRNRFRSAAAAPGD
jgi:glycosyltransferase 2 family protein